MIKMALKTIAALQKVASLSAFTSCSSPDKCVIYLFKINFLQALFTLSNFLRGGVGVFFVCVFCFFFFLRDGVPLSFLKSLSPGFLTKDSLKRTNKGTLIRVLQVNWSQWRDVCATGI